MSDLIDRQAAINALDSINCCGWVEDSWARVSGIIEHVPSAQAERKRGRWQLDCQRLPLVYCSECGDYALRCEEYGQVKTKFCPNCGADMRGEQDG